MVSSIGCVGVCFDLLVFLWYFHIKFISMHHFMLNRVAGERRAEKLKYAKLSEQLQNLTKKSETKSIPSSHNIVLFHGFQQVRQ